MTKNFSLVRQINTKELIINEKEIRMAKDGEDEKGFYMATKQKFGNTEKDLKRDNNPRRNKDVKGRRLTRIAGDHL